MLKRFKFLRGTPLDPFGYSEDRRIERKLVAEYLSMLETVMADLTPANYPTAVALAALPEKIRGFGPVKKRSLKLATAEQAGLFEQFRAGVSPFLKAAE